MFLILSDRAISKDRVALSSLMAVGAVHHYLIDMHARSKLGIIVETGEAREIHHYCTLIGYGADAIFPYLVWDNIYVLHKKQLIDESITKDQIVPQYKKAVDYGICKVFAKMGISTIDSYRGSQIFEIVGLSNKSSR